MNKSKLLKSKTLTLTGQEVEITCTGSGTAIRNDGTETIYVSGEAGIVTGTDGVVSIPAGGSVVLSTREGKLYVAGKGTAMVMETVSSANPFKMSAQSGGSGADEVARAAIEAHSGNAGIHITAEERTRWSSKADKSDIPAIPESLPANGGNADTLGGRASTDFANAYNLNIGEYLSGRFGDIRALAYLLPTGGLNVSTDSVPDVTFPLTGDLLLVWSKSLYTGNDLMYGTLMVRPMAADGDTYICSVFNGSRYTSWQRISDGGNAASLEDHPASDFVLKSEYDMLAARVAALENA